MEYVGNKKWLMINACLKYFVSVLLTILFLCSNVFADTEKKLSKADITKLEDRVGQFLEKDNVTRRRHVEEVFLLAEIYAKEGKDKEALNLYQEALRVDSWRLKYQLKAANLIYKYGDKNQAIEKAEIVQQYAEDENLIIKAEEFLFDLGVEFAGEVNEKEHQFVEDVEIVIVPIGKMNKRLLFEAKNGLQEKMGIKYSITKNEIDPGEFDRSYLDRYASNIWKKLVVRFLKLIPKYNRRLKQLENQGQFDADRLISNLQKSYIIGKKPEIKGYLGITEEDIFSGDNNFLFGLATKGYGVMSYHRFRAAFNNEPPNRPKLRNRVVKQGISSSFFILGIPRCTTPTCIRAYPHSLIEHDQKESELCSWCREQLKIYLKKENVLQR